MMASQHALLSPAGKLFSVLMHYNLRLRPSKRKAANQHSFQRQRHCMCAGLAGHARLRWIGMHGRCHAQCERWQSMPWSAARMHTCRRAGHLAEGYTVVSKGLHCPGKRKALHAAALKDGVTVELAPDLDRAWNRHCLRSVIRESLRGTGSFVDMSTSQSCTLFVADVQISFIPHSIRVPVALGLHSL
jgi:hypothetical protein